MQSSQQCMIIQTLASRNEKLLQENLILADEIHRLRALVQYYQLKDAENIKNQDHFSQVDSKLESCSGEVMERIEKMTSETTSHIDKRMKQLKKQVFYKRYEGLEKKYEAKTQECEGLKIFRDKLIRLNNSYEPNTKISLEDLFKWVSNQVIRAKGKAGKTSGMKVAKNKGAGSKQEKSESTI